jgi:tetratricopeptide (TPR) repeat protein
VASSYNDIGLVYDDKNQYDRALEYLFKSLELRKDIFGEKNNDVASSYNNIT